VRSLGTFDLIAAVHVIYVWPDPLAPLTALREALTPGGTLAIGMLLRGDMPKGARENFPKFATRLYETEDDVREQLVARRLPRRRRRGEARRAGTQWATGSRPRFVAAPGRLAPESAEGIRRASLCGR